MRVAMIGPFGLSPKATMSARAVPLARALAAEGHEILVLMPPWHTPERAGQRWQESSLAFEYVPLGPPGPVFSQMATAWRLVRRALAWRPQVIHCFKPKGYAGLAALVLWHLRRLRLTDVRLVVDEDDWEGAGGWNELEPYPTLLRRFFAWQERWGLTHCDAVTVASRTLQSLVWALGVPAQRVFYLPNGVAAWSEAVCERSGDASPVRQKYHLGACPVVLLYTRFFEYDVARAVETLRAIAAQEPKVRFLVVGRGLFARDDRRFDELVRAAELQEHTVRAGWLPVEKLGDHLCAADVAVHLLDDNLVNRCKCSAKLVDLLACGLAVVADAVGQNREYIRHNETGVLVSPGDVQEMAAQVVALLRDPSRRRRIGSAAARAMRAEYNWASLARQALDAYQGVQASSGSAGTLAPRAGSSKGSGSRLSI